MRTPSDPLAVEEALARAVISRALRQALLPPAAAAGTVTAAAGRAALERAARLLDGDGGAELVAAVGDLVRQAPPPAARLELERQRLFGHTLRGAVCPYECEYGSRVPLQQAHELADLQGFYRAFGLRPAGPAGERADHVACELEFLEFLSAKEAVALAGGDLEMVETTRQAERKFLRHHLGRFGIAFAHRLEEAADEEVFCQLARVCAAFLRLACATFAVEAGPELLALRPADPDGMPMACGTGGQDDGPSALVQIGGRASPRVPA